MQPFTIDRYGEPTVRIYAPCYSALSAALADDSANYILVYEHLRKICLKGKVYDFSQLTGYSISVTPEVSSTTKASASSVIGRAVVGGVLLGGVGAIIGATTAKTKTDYKTTDKTTITIFTNSLSEPSIVLDLMPMDKEKVSQIEGVIKIITTAPNTSPRISQGFSPLEPDAKRITVGDIVTKKKDAREVVVLSVEEADGKIKYQCMGDDNTFYLGTDELDNIDY